MSFRFFSLFPSPSLLCWCCWSCRWVAFSIDWHFRAWTNQRTNDRDFEWMSERMEWMNISKQQQQQQQGKKLGISNIINCQSATITKNTTRTTTTTTKIWYGTATPKVMLKIRQPWLLHVASSFFFLPFVCSLTLVFSLFPLLYTRTHSLSFCSVVE